MVFWTNPYSIDGLKERVAKLPQCPYRLVMELAIDKLEQKKVTRDEVKKAIEYVRTGKSELMLVAIKMLKPSQNEIEVALKLLNEMKESGRREDQTYGI